MNSKVTVKKESKVTININGKDYVYTEEEARDLYEGLSKIFMTDKSPSPSEELQKYVDKYRETDNQEFKKHYGDWWTNTPWKQPDIWCQIALDDNITLCTKP